MTATDKPRNRRKDKSRLRFETLLTDLSARFINLPADRLDAEIVNAQRQICEFLDLDVSSLWQVSPDRPGSLLLTHVHHPLDFPPVPKILDAGESFPWTYGKLLRGESAIVSRLMDVSAAGEQDLTLWRYFDFKSVLTLPLSVGGGPLFGALNFDTCREERGWPVELVHRLQLVAQVFANALARKRADLERKKVEEQLRQTLMELQQFRDRLQVENLYLREQIRRDDGHDGMTGESEPLLRMLAKAKQVAPTDSAVLITGETGTGKELLAQAIHDHSRRHVKTMVKVNCAALPAPLIEGELFGREKGAYTGAMTQQVGRFELAHGSTIFLDEIGDLPLELQGKLLRVLQDGRFERLGSVRTISVNVRVIAATNHDLDAMVRDGTFREDLFHRLNVFPIETPPLRTRVADIPLLVWTFVQEFNQKMGKAIDTISRPVMEQLKRHAWPGNIRELRNLIERAVIVSTGRSLNLEFPARGSGPGPGALPVTLAEMERKHIGETLERVHWRISGKQGAANLLGLKPTTLHSRMKKLGLSRPKPCPKAPDAASTRSN